MDRFAKRVSLITSLALLIGGIIAAARDDGDGQRVNVDLARFYNQGIHWGRCDSPPPSDQISATEVRAQKLQECAIIKVPKNYGEPDDGTLNIAISRLTAGEKSGRLGVLLLNPGGPGGPGLFMPAKVALKNAELSSRFDLIGFDPRGTGKSTALICNGPTRPPQIITRPTGAQMELMADQARRQEENCQHSTRSLRPYVNTANTARDMDVIRGTLREGKINFMGVSYGTYLGAVYGTLFPNHLNRSVLDSSMHPDWLYYEATKQMSVVAKRNVEEWATWVGDRSHLYGLGSSEREVMAAIEWVGQRLSGQSSATPRSNRQTARLDQNAFDQFLGGFGSRPRWHKLALLVAELHASLANEVPIRAGLISAMERDSRSREDVHLNGTHTAVTCEAEWPADLGIYYQEMSRFARKFPYGKGATAAAPTACTFRSFELTEAHIQPERRGYPPGLVVQASHDPKTPYEGGVAMARQLDNRLLTVLDEGTHGMHGSNQCATERITSYLVEGRLPSVGVSCEGARRPSIRADAGRP